MKLTRLIDLPPVWLMGTLALVWLLDRLAPVGLFGPAGQAVGAAMVIFGLGLTAIAGSQMVLKRTTVIPHERPSALVTTGVFRLSRNPIYLADALILSGVILYWDVPLAAPLVFGFMLLIQRRFILPEEALLHDLFGDTFTDWTRRTGRWFGLSLR
ncbi:MAG: isoprenylcysteine carboxylmethyltransferase family protein [Rhodobacteraceae bacterium]|nr:isoprenylcysteine carboxylmethyltransferase family protein [Paracoccaceae bacterium]